MSKYADPLDIASEQEEKGRLSDIQAVRDRLKPEQVKDAEGKWPEPNCVDCGAPIGEKRLELTGSKICIDCATLNEKKGKFYGKPKTPTR